MRIETSAGKKYTVRVMSEMIRNKNQVLIVLEDEMPIVKAAQEFDGLQFIKRFLEEKSVSYEMYEGFSRLVSVRIEDDGVRLILEKP